MSVKIRLARGGSKKRPYYRIVVATSTAPRDGRFIEKVGTYNPMLSNKEERVTLVEDRITYWLENGAIPTDRVVNFLNKANIGQDFAAVKKVNKKLAQSRAAIEAKLAEEKAKAEAEAAAAAAEEEAA